ncbi:MAG: hypothetical protein ACLQVD_04975 [Capsulimonadaceae bacterium]
MRQVVMIVVVALMAVMIPIGFFEAWHEATIGEQQISAFNDEYARAPGCIEPADDRPVEQTLPPCTEVPMTVIDTATHPERDRVNVSGVRTAIDITMRNPSGELVKFWDIGDFSSHCRIGAVIDVQYWRGLPQQLRSGRDTTRRVQLSRNGYSSGYFANLSPGGQAHIWTASRWFLASVLLITLLFGRHRLRNRITI